jgi:hypothetical protein
MKTVTCSLFTIFHLRSAFILLALALGTLALVHRVEAVNPPPDGGYPGGNTAEGQSALLSLTTRGFNTAVGFSSLRSDTDGAFNTAIGAGTLFANTASQNTATGAGVLLSNTTGVQNTANGAFALFSNTEGSNNTANGGTALQSNTTGVNNTANGSGALVNNTIGSFNTANGAFALQNNTTGSNNTAVGFGALINSTGTANIGVGLSAGGFVTTANNVICVGTGLLGKNVSNTCFIDNIRGVTTQNANAIPVLIDSSGQLGTASSSRRFKKEVKPMNSASEAILALKPVTFHYKSDTTNTPQFGLIAEEVAAVNPDLVVPDEKGEIYTVRYDAVNAMLLNEFLKEHRKVQEHEKTIAELKSGMTALAATVKEQAAQIQKVSAQLAAASPSRGGLEASKFATGRIRRGGPASQVVNNP